MQAIVVRMDIFFRMDIFSGWTGRTYTHNLIWGPHFRVLRHWSLRDQRRTATTSCERHQSKVTMWNIYIHTHMHTYIHTCTLSFVQDTPPCQSRGWLWQPRVGKTSVQTSAVDRHDKSWGFSENMERGIGENVGTVAAPKYAMERKFVERYSKKMLGSSQKIKLLLLIVFKCK